MQRIWMCWHGDVESKMGIRLCSTRASFTMLKIGEFMEFRGGVQYGVRLEIMSGVALYVHLGMNAFIEFEVSIELG
jgi:hypothetical protein